MITRESRLLCYHSITDTCMREHGLLWTCGTDDTLFHIRHPNHLPGTQSYQIVPESTWGHVDSGTYEEALLKLKESKRSFPSHFGLACM